MNAVERVAYYAYHVENEAAEVIDENRPPKDWPKEGNITIKGLKMRYSKDAPLVLKDLSFEIRSREKIGVVCQVHILS
jgi:ABC-type bacteriocin/lantibiotic exporter with double-glycine peptidase domain